MKGIILAGGSGTRLYPLTKTISKQMLPVYDKPMIYYPLSTLMMAGIRDILIISTPRDLPNFKELLGTGKDLGLNFTYLSQEKPEGLAQAFIIGEDFIGTDDVAMVLGDNIFHGTGFKNILTNIKKGATIFAYQVNDPSRYGIVEFDSDGKAISLEEKPVHPKSKFAIPGLYFYDNRVVEIAKTIKPSSRNELEITDINIEYLKLSDLNVCVLDRGFAWLDTGTHEALHEASNYVETIEKRQGMKIACIEEIAYLMGYIDENQIEKTARSMYNDYGKYLMNLIT